MKNNMRRVLMLAAMIVLPQGVSYAQAAVSRRTHPVTFEHVAAARSSASRGGMLGSRTMIGALVGGVTGLAVGLAVGHAANFGCRLGDSHCNPKTEQVKVMVVSGVALGAVGTGLGYLVGKAWPGEGETTISRLSLRSRATGQ